MPFLSQASRRILGSAFGLGLVVGTATMYIAWQHNPMNEFHDPARTHWGALFAIGLSWLAVCLIVGGVVAALVRVLLRARA